MAASDAIPVPRKNVAYRFSFAIRKPSDSTLITTWAGMDSEVSLDGGAFSDCTNEATEIGTSGCGYIDLTAEEMNADCVLLKVTVTNTGAVPLVFVLYPESAGDYRVADTQKVDVETIKTNPVVNAGTITFPTTSTLASTTNITAGTIENLTNLPTMPIDWITANGVSEAAVTKIQAGLDAAAVRSAVGMSTANLDTQLSGLATLIVGVLNKVGSWAGSGVNSILGAFQAIMRADASVPSDIGGTYSPTTDSLESLGTAVAGLGNNLGSGADSCTLRIRETDLTPVADADVWITTDSAGTNVIAGTRQTNASGQVTFLLDAGLTYYLWAQKDGWEGIQGTAFTAVAD